MYHVPDRKKEFYVTDTDDDTVNVRQGAAIPATYGLASSTTTPDRIFTVKSKVALVPFLWRQFMLLSFVSLFLSFVLSMA